MWTIKTFQFNMLPVNAYVVWDESKEAVVIDAGCFYPSEKAALKEYIDRNKLTIKHLICTHLHFDHVFGNPFMKETFGVLAEAHEADLPWLEQITERVKQFGIMDCEAPVPLKGYLHEGDTVSFGSHTLQIFHIPGHSQGSLVFYCPEENALFTGDVLFQRSIGRTDLDGGTEEQLIEGIQQKLLPLPDATVVYPGHGPTTTIGDERRYNVYLSDNTFLRKR
jgi:glyoxylase-like metal-dependent hydrolase (beta-lactamase superfamily II)